MATTRINPVPLLISRRMSREKHIEYSSNVVRTLNPSREAEFDNKIGRWLGALFANNVRLIIVGGGSSPQTTLPLKSLKIAR